MLVLHGSRARRDHRPNSDWDFGFLGSPDVGRLSARLVEMVGTDAVDVVDLAGPARCCASELGPKGVLIAGDPAEFLRFRLQATQFWCDAGPVIRAAHDALLASL